MSPPLKSSRPLARGSSPAPAPPAKKRTKLRKEEIVAEATRLFAERGYEGASMGDLAERVGLRKASLFHHFPSKDVLYATVLEQLLGGIRAAVDAETMSQGSFEERLDRLSDAVTSRLGADPHAARLLVREAMDDGHVMRERLSDILQGLLASALEFSRAGQRAGAFNPEIDMTQVVVSLIGVHLMPFAIGEVVERFVGESPFQAPFIEQRKAAVREQTRQLYVCRDKKQR